MVQAGGWGPVVGDGEGLAKRLGEMIAEKYRVVVAADGPGSAGRLAELLRDRGLDFTVATDTTDLTKPGGYVAVAPLHRGCALPEAKLAIVAPKAISPDGDEPTVSRGRASARAPASSRT